MTPQESIDEIRSMVGNLENYLISPVQAVRYRAQQQYAALVSRFFRENGNYLAPQQKTACRDDVPYFMSLLQAAEDFYDRESLDQTERDKN